MRTWTFDEINESMISFKGTLGASCIICGETVVLTEGEEMVLRSGYNIGNKVCDKCRQAVLYVREQMQ